MPMEEFTVRDIRYISRIRRVKLIFDLLFAAIFIPILLPFFILVSLIICLDSKGPPLFTQERLGLNGKSFQIIKFRSMVLNAMEKGDGIRIRSKNDQRITRVGRILRSTSLDELPQLFNVLKGEMSLVGPRPPLTFHPYEGYENYPDATKKRFLLRPGLTGLSQVRVRNAAPWPIRLEYDVQYIENVNIWLDAKIILLTAKGILFRTSIAD